MRLAILKADSVRPELAARHGEYPDMFRRLLSVVVPSLQVDIFDVRAGQYPERVSCYAGVIITGSQFSAYDEDPWIGLLMEHVRRLHQARVKLLGVCFGHQIIALALGGAVERAKVGWGVGVHDLALHAGFTDDLSPAPAHGCALIVSHQDQVTALPPGARLIASSDFCPHAMFGIGRHILAIQGHPEFTSEYARDLLSTRLDRIPAATADEAARSFARGHDGLRVAAWVVSFFAHSESSANCRAG